jgi:hypothetical protein
VGAEGWGRAAAGPGGMGGVPDRQAQGVPAY